MLKRSVDARRRYLIGGSDYVSTGLFAHFDGINNTGSGHSDITSTWCDLSPNRNNLPIALENIEWHDSYISYNTGIKNSSWLQMPVSPDFTLEYLLEHNMSTLETEGINFYPLTGSFSSNVNFVRTPLGIILRIRGSRYEFQFESEPYKPHLISVVVKPPQSILVYCDGKLVDSRAVTINAVSVVQAALGYNNGENAASKENVKLYACRLYSKALSSSEILQNYKKDKERYSL